MDSGIRDGIWRTATICGWVPKLACFCFRPEFSAGWKRVADADVEVPPPQSWTQSQNLCHLTSRRREGAKAQVPSQLVFLTAQYRCTPWRLPLLGTTTCRAAPSKERISLLSEPQQQSSHFLSVIFHIPPLPSPPVPSPRLASWHVSRYLAQCLPSVDVGRMEGGGGHRQLIGALRTRLLGTCDFFCCRSYKNEHRVLSCSYLPSTRQNFR